MKKFLITLLLAGCSSGQVHVENDILAQGITNNDRYYTHGTKFSYYEDEPNERKTYSLGQSIYTPSKKRADALPEDLKKSRPYTGWLYAEYRNTILQEDNNSRTVWGLQLGCTGRCSLAKETQQGVHKLLDQSIPTWDKNYSLKSEPGFILEREKYYDLYQAVNFYSDYFTLLKTGNIINSVSSGLSFKYGINFSRFEPEDITFKQAKEESPWSYYLFGDAEVRYIAYNHFLQGSMFQSERHTVDANPFVGEANLGFRVGYDKFKFSYNYTMITDEWSDQGGPFMFGGIDISW